MLEARTLSLGERLRAAIAQMAPMQAHPELRLTASIGAALSRPGEASSDLLRRADHALYAAKSSGRNRVDTAKVAATIGEALTRPDAQFVRDVTGFAIGGIPPLGHDRTLRTFVDPDLLAYPTVFAAAGTPNAIMELDPRALCTATGATIIPVT